MIMTNTKQFHLLIWKRNGILWVGFFEIGFVIFTILIYTPPKTPKLFLLFTRLSHLSTILKFSSTETIKTLVLLITTVNQTKKRATATVSSWWCANISPVTLPSLQAANSAEMLSCQKQKIHLKQYWIWRIIFQKYHD